MAIRVNIHAFTLAGWVTEASPWLDSIRAFVREKNQNLLDELVRAGVVHAAHAQHNIVVTAGRSVIAQRLAGITNYTGTINYGALGTQNAPVPNNANTQLGNEVYRKVASSLAASGNVAYVDFFYAAGDVNGTFTEFGNFIDGAAGANTGQLFSYIATGGWIKSAQQSLFVSCQYTIN